MSRAAPLILLLGVGCAVPRDAGFPDVKNLARDRGLRIHWNQGGPEDAQVAALVQRMLSEDLTVASATEIALLNHPTLQATYERLGVAQADLVQAGMLKNPSLGFSLHAPLDSGPRITGVLGFELSILTDFLDLFMRPLRKRLAEAELDRAKLEVADLVIDHAARVRSAFFSVQAAEQVLALKRTVLEATSASVELAARQNEAGNLSDLDLANEQSLYIETQVDVARAETQLALDRERLTSLLGVWGKHTEWRTRGPLADLPPAESPLDHVESFAIAHRLDLAAAKKEVDLAAHALSITKGERYIPGARIGAHIDKDPEGVTFAGPNIELGIPIFDQGQAEVARLRSQLRQAERRLDARAIEIRSEVRAARARLLSARSTAQYYKTTLLPLRERIVALSQRQYNAMLLGVYQLIAAKKSEVNTYREYIEAIRDYWIARSDLERAAGGPIPEYKEGATHDHSP